MKKARGFLLAEGALSLLLVLLAAGRLLQSLPGAALSLQRLVGRRELQRTRQDLHTRLEAALLNSVSQARVVQGRHGTELECYHRYSQAQWTFFVADSASTHLPTLYKGTWNQESRQKGVNPLTPPHVEVTGFAVEALPEKRLRWHLGLRHRRTGQETELDKVYRYGR
ncbi:MULTISPECIES: hypothetical protein [Acidaminococcus]|uniref:hypothetical protein n=1 Tax=Acidaminococcus TaxID=904 RepID=UPI00259A2947|nr:hypothetical protein [Acidaminococcus sp.]MDO5598058.1 hypothetical protein [Acidaminococcus sp.]